MSWILEYFVVYLSCVYICSAGYYVELTIILFLSTSILGVSHAIQNENKL